MSTYQIYALKFAGPFTSSGALLWWNQDWERQVERAYYLWLVQGEAGMLLVDAGLSPAQARDRDLSPYQSPARVVDRAGLAPEEVERVALTHLHWDHAGGVNLFPRAKVYVSASEWRFWMEEEVSRTPPFMAVCDQATREELAAVERAGRLELVEDGRELLPGVRCHLAPGHTPGLMVISVPTASGTAVIGSDCGHTFRNYREQWPSIFITDLAAWMRSLPRVMDLASAPELVFPGHDIALCRDYPRVAEGVYRLA
jgi:glyoxylase-like metal-dependent hydrolase (beta-lactamase superfamily II)